MKPFLLGITLLLAGCDYARDFIGGGTPANASAQTVMMDTAGVVARRVLADLPIDYVSALPDGRSVVKNDWDMGELVLYDLENGATRRLTHHNLSPWDSGGAFGPSVSPDGRLVAYNWEGYKPSYSVEVRLVDVAGGTPRVLFRDVDWVEVRSWSPDGRSFVALNQPEKGVTQILLIPIDGGKPRVVRTLNMGGWPHQVDFSPDGRSLIYDRAVEVDDGERDIYLLDLDTDREYPIVQSPADDRLLGWVPGSSNILFSSDRTGTTGVWSQRLENGRMEGAPVLVKPDFWRAKPKGFKKDGTFYYTVQSSGPNVYTATVDIATGEVGAAELLPLSEPITKAALGWSSDGRALGVLSDGLGLTVRSVASGESRTYAVPRPHYYPGWPMRWAADGSAIFWRARVASSPTEGATWGLLRFDLSTGRTTVFDVPVKDREEFNWFELLPDGNSALVRRRIPPEFTADSQNVARLSLLDLKTGAERDVFDVRGSGLPFAVSPDGSRVAVAPLVPADRGPGEVLRGSSELYVIPLNGAPEPRKTATGPARFTRFVDLLWEPSGKAIIQVTNEGTAPETALQPSREHLVDRFALDGSPLKTIKLTDPERARFPGLLSPTANRLAFLAGEAAYELWTLKGLPGSPSAARPR